MSDNSSFFQTKRGLISLCTNPVDMALGAAAGVSEELSAYDFSDNSDKNWGLATKFYVLSTIDEHNYDSDAHPELFSSILARFEDIVTSSGTFCFNEIRDLSGNSIKANGMVRFNGGTDTGYIVVSRSRYASFDELSSKLDSVAAGISSAIASKQDKLTAGSHVNISYDAGEKKTYISTDYTEYVLPKATESTLGGVYVDTALDSSSSNPVAANAFASALAEKQTKLNGSDSVSVADDGKISVVFGPVAEGCTLPVDGNAVQTALDAKQDGIQFSSTHFTSSDGVISPKFGPISEGSSAIVSGGDVFSALYGKQDVISFDGMYFGTDGNSVTIAASGSVAEGDVAIPNGGTVYAFASSISPFFKMCSSNIVLETSTDRYVVEFKNRSVNSMQDKVGGAALHDATVYAYLPPFSEGNSRSFKVYRTVYGLDSTDDHYAASISMPSSDGGSAISYSYSGDNPFSQILLPKSSSATKLYLYDFVEIRNHVFRVTRALLTTAP